MAPQLNEQAKTVNQIKYTWVKKEKDIDTVSPLLCEQLL